MSQDRKAAILAVLSELKTARINFGQCVEELDQIYEFYGWKKPEHE